MDTRSLNERQADGSGACYLGVDGGGSKTLAVIVDAAGVERGRGSAGSSNHQAVGIEAAATNLRQAIDAAAHAASCSRLPESAWLGLAGVDHAGDIALLWPHVEPLATQVRLTNDAELVLSGLERQVGVALIAGTGSIALGRDAAGHSARASGWGHILGDEGSGYDLGCQALRVAVRAADGRGRPTRLLQAILDDWALSEPELLLQRVYPDGDKAAIARLAPLVLRCAEAGDAVALAIARRAALELAVAAQTVSRRLGFTAEPLPVALGGGLLIHDELYRQEVLRHLERSQPLGCVAIVREPALSAARAARQLHRMASAASQRSGI